MVHVGTAALGCPAKRSEAQVEGIWSSKPREPDHRGEITVYSFLNQLDTDCNGGDPWAEYFAHFC
jgi:hypothetical protein